MQSRLRGWLDTLSTVLVIVAAGVLIYQQMAKPAPAQAAPVAVEDVTVTIDKSFVRNVTGTGDLALVEFSDFQCPFCARHAKETAPALKAIDGVRYVSIHLPLPMHQAAVPAAIAAECAAEQGKFWEMHTALFDNQQWLDTSVADGFSQYVLKLGLDAARFDACRTSEAALARVTADQDEAQRLKVRATPAIFIGRMRADGGVDLLKRINGAQPAEAFTKELTALRGEKDKRS